MTCGICGPTNYEAGYLGRTGNLLPKPLVTININYSWSNNINDLFIWFTSTTIIKASILILQIRRLRLNKVTRL